VTILIEDSPRNLLTWIEAAVGGNVAGGAVISPFASPLMARSQRRDASQMKARMDDVGGVSWFDACTHALQMPQTGDFRYYDDYDLWGGTRGDLSSPPLISDHVQRVFELQESLGVPHLAPTVLVSTPQSVEAQRALEISFEAVTRDPNCWLSIAGTGPFWSGHQALDAHIGALAQLAPGGWFVSVVRPIGTLPVVAEPLEVAGTCRTVHALSLDAQVHVSHGDLAALPLVAAGASTVGSGWDQRQRVLAATSFLERDPSADGGGWYERPTLRNLVGSLKRPEAELLVARDAPMASRLVPGSLPPPGPKEAFMHHVGALDVLAGTLVTAGGREHAYRQLVAIYEAARTDWPAVVNLTNSPLSHREWVEPFLAGLRDYGAVEGW
jgi:hypothetical protein